MYNCSFCVELHTKKALVFWTLSFKFRKQQKTTEKTTAVLFGAKLSWVREERENQNKTCGVKAALRKPNALKYNNKFDKNAKSNVYANANQSCLKAH